LKKKGLWIVISNILIFITIVLAMVLFLNKVEWYVQVLAYGATISFTTGSIIFYFKQNQEQVRSFFACNIITLIIVAVFTIFNLCGFFETFADLEKVRQKIQDAGIWGYIIFILLTILNVIVLPLPSFTFILIGLPIFGQLNTFIISYICFVIGAIICFFIGRLFGNKAVVWCIGKEKTEKYKNMLGAKGNFLFVMMQILPFFPDDLICMIAGLTSMKFLFFLFSMMIIKAIYIGLVCLLGTGTIIPFSGWGIPVWIAIAAVLIILFILFCKYQKQLETWYYNRKNKKNKN